MLTALAIGIHNFPEGLATFFAALPSLASGIPVAVAIALHNIPEGISVSVPMYYATGSRKKALMVSSFRGVSEPVGAIVGYVIFRAVYFGRLDGHRFRSGGRDYGLRPPTN